MIQKIEMIDPRELFVGKTNPRKEFDGPAMKRLERSIAEIGINQNLIVRAGKGPAGEGFEIVAGERRWRAAMVLGLGEVPCVVRELSDLETVALQLVENIQREKLSPVEEAGGVSDLLGMGLDRAAVAKCLGKDAAWVQVRMDLGELPEVAKRAVSSGRLGLGAVADLVRVEGSERQAFVQEILKMGAQVTDEQVQMMVWERYERPRANLKLWAAWWETTGEARGGGRLEDPEGWAEYVRPYGEAVAPFKLVQDTIGGIAARAGEESVTWGQLAEVHGVPTLAVPVGGVREDMQNVVRVIDRGAVEAAERAAKSAKQPYTIGPKLRALEKKAESAAAKAGVSMAQIPERGRGFVADIEAETPEGRREELKQYPWNPWAIAEAWGALESGGARIAQVLVDVMDLEAAGWRDRAAAALGVLERNLVEFSLEEFGSLHPVVIWRVLDRWGGVDDAKPHARIAAALGMLEFWKNAIEAR
jgi:ParB family transcriptional regulator, chromosome partitioning protein